MSATYSSNGDGGPRETLAELSMQVRTGRHKFKFMVRIQVENNNWSARNNSRDEPSVSQLAPEVTAGHSQRTLAMLEAT